VRLLITVVPTPVIVITLPEIVATNSFELFFRQFPMVSDFWSIATHFATKTDNDGKYNLGFLSS
jgi:hypothetical protein